MKKKLFAFLLFLTCCSPRPLPPVATQGVQEEHFPSIDAFKFGQGCSNICWLGIHPGITPISQAMTLLRASDQIDQKSFEKSVDSVYISWFTDKTKIAASNVRVYFANDRVESIYFNSLYFFTIKDFINLLGQPDEIGITIVQEPDEWSTAYAVYYPELKAQLETNSGSKSGPEPNDPVALLKLGVEINDPYRQPWLGYGHLQDYLPRAIPTATFPPPHRYSRLISLLDSRKCW